VIVLPNPAPTVPGAPVITSVTAEHHAVKVVYTPPASNGGSRITRYQVVCASNDGGGTRTKSDEHSPTVVSSLAAGRTYTCTVAARNKVGFSPASTPSSPVVALA
jgi:hypothetical protein